MTSHHSKQGTRGALGVAILGLLTVVGCSFREYDYGVSSIATGGVSSQVTTETGGLSSSSTTGVGGTSDPSSAASGGAMTEPTTIGGQSTSASGGASSQPMLTGGSSSRPCPDDSGVLCEPACAAVVQQDTPIPANLLVHWTFDKSSTDALVHDESNSHALAFFVDSSPDAIAPQLDKQVRINGQGNSIYLDGHHYYADNGSEPTPSLQNGGTIAALIALPHDPLLDGGTTVWPILSTISTSGKDDCGGYQLEMRLDSEQQPEVAFSYAYPSTDAATGCQTAVFELPLQRSSWAWNTGHWHHVAATYSPAGTNQAQVALYWDSDSPGSPYREFLAHVGQMSGSTSTHKLYVGTNAHDSNEPSAQKFKGNIDEIAIFDRPLQALQLAQFSLNATTYPGPSECRWQASESHQDGVGAEVSTTTWVTHDYDHVQVSIDDADWGAGAVAARLAAPTTSRDLKRYGEVILTAEDMVPKKDMDNTPFDTRNGIFEFALSAGDDSCTWYIAENGSNTYRIDLSNPDYCQGKACQFPIGAVEWATIRSIWAYPMHKYTSLLRYTIRGIDLVEADKTKGKLPLVPGRYGGVLGPNSWCWRTQAFQAKFGADARFSPNMTANFSVLEATLSGQKFSSSAVVADFGDDTFDLSHCAGIRIVADIDQDEVASERDSFPALTLQDRSGAWKQWNWKGTADTVWFSGSSPAWSDDGRQIDPDFGFWDPYAGKFHAFALNEVALLAIQKDYQYPNSGDAKATLTVSNVEFVDKYSKPRCEIVNP